MAPLKVRDLCGELHGLSGRLGRDCLVKVVDVGKYASLSSSCERTSNSPNDVIRYTVDKEHLVLMGR